MYTSEGSDWSTGINICNNGLLGLRLNNLVFRSLIPPLSHSHLTTEAGEREEQGGRQTDHVLPGQVAELGQGGVDPDGEGEADAGQGHDRGVQAKLEGVAGVDVTL